MLEDYSLEQLGVFIALSIGSLSGCIVMVLKATTNSRCKQINCLCFKCQRDILKGTEMIPTNA